MIEVDALHNDEAARERIANNLDTSFLVEAGAGSGKTTSIVGRMIAMIRERKAEARNIAAITFTNKAAAELKGRFRLRLEQELAKMPADLGGELGKVSTGLERELGEAVAGSEKEALEAALRQMP